MQDEESSRLDEETPPDPAGLVRSLTALGYSLESAVADIVDNSIDALASTIAVYFHWDPVNPFVVVSDDGSGMTEGQLRTAMAFAERGPHVEREVHHLGRFGMGLKTASFSQAHRLSVWSRAENSVVAFRQWDLDHVVASRAWNLRTYADSETAAVLEPFAAQVATSGTVVLWTKLTHLIDELADLDSEAAHSHFLQSVSRVDKHLGMVFARFLTGGRAGRRRVRILVNGSEVQPWDPFMERHAETRPQPVERLELSGHTVVLRPFVLPQKKKLTNDEYEEGAGPLGWLDQQGYYVFRNDRLIVAGGWLGLPGLRSDEKHVLARVGIELPSSLDLEWSIDVKKASATPPAALRRSLLIAARALRTEAQRVLTTINRVTANTHADELSYVWRPERNGDQTRLKINYSHPLVEEALRDSGDGKATVKSLLRFLEETVPIPALRMMHDAEKDRDYQPFADAPAPEIVSFARRMLAAYLNSGLTAHQARTRLLNTSPFNEYPELPSLLELD